MERLFDVGDSQPTELLHGASSAVLHPSAIERDRADDLFEALLADIPWEQRPIRHFGRTVLQPRLIAWLAETDASYTYSGLRLDPQPWSPPAAELRDLCAALAGVTFNGVLLNLYRDGTDSVAWHSDDEPEFGTNPVVASVSLGAERRFDLRHRETGETVKTVLPHGSVLIMSGATQHEWIHQIAKTARVHEPRINLTFRKVVTRA